MHKTQNPIQIFTIIFFILLAGIYRILPHPYNFSPIAAMALFGGAYFSNRILAFIFPLITLWLSDLIINNVLFAEFFPTFTWFYSGFYWVYGSFILIGCIGLILKNNVKIWTVPIASIAGAVLFFLITNFGVWASGTMYPANLQGLVLCYTAGIPFFAPTILGDILFAAVLFGGFELIKSKVATLQQAKI